MTEKQNLVNDLFWNRQMIEKQNLVNDLFWNRRLDLFLNINNKNLADYCRLKNVKYSNYLRIINIFLNLDLVYKKDKKYYYTYKGILIKEQLDFIKKQLN